MTRLIQDIDLSGLELLVVEDDTNSSLVISRVLTMHGAKVETALNGSDGLRKFQEKLYPIIITDINMPIMSGLELVKRIKVIDPEAFVIATSANRETDCLISAIELGFSDYFLKPIELEKLLLSVNRCRDNVIVRQQLENEREKFKTVVNCLGEGITIKDLEYRILYQNLAMTELFGNQVGSFCYKVFGLDEPCQDCPTAEALKDGKFHSSCRNYQLDRTMIHIESTASLIRDSRGTITGTVEIIRDISERVKNEQIIRDMAFHDPLTSLPNRRLFEDRLEQAIAKSHRYGMKFGLLYLDLDYFKNINDSLGHETGDEVLIEVSERIKSSCKRDLDTVSRQGGDEFCIIFTDCGDRNNLEVLAKNILLAFSDPIRVHNSDVQITTSIGISIFPDDGTDAKLLEQAADSAMYSAKKSGKNTYKFFRYSDSLCTGN